MRVRIERETYRLTAAQVWISDYSEFGEYNHPEMTLTLSTKTSSINAQIRYQRHRIGGGSAMCDRADAEGPTEWIDTAHRWSHSYGGAVELSYAGSFGFQVGRFWLRTEDRVRVAVMRKLARAFGAHGLYNLRDEVLRTVAALHWIAPDVGIELQYTRFTGGPPVDPTLREVRESCALGANARAQSADPFLCCRPDGDQRTPLAVEEAPPMTEGERL